MSGWIRVLIVEDDRSLALQLQWLLRQDHEIFLASSRSQALGILERENPHVMLLDLGLPPRPEDPSEGLALLREALEMAPLLKVIVMTAHGEQATAREALSRGAYDFLVKPVREQLLVTLVKRAFFRRELEEHFFETRKEDLPLPMVVSSAAMKEVIDQVRAVAPLPVSCLIQGETGTGKELLARLLHHWSGRSASPMVVVDCTSIPVSIAESELFGAEKGAYTGAVARKEGRVAQAQGGSLLLDEVGELSLELQSKLLRFLETREFTPVGGRTRQADVRVLAATNRDLREEVKRGRFRLDLFHRLCQVEIRVPPLRQRPEEIPALARHLLASLGHEFRVKLPQLTPEAIQSLSTYPFPGNVRELRNMLSRALVLSRGRPITPSDLGLAHTYGEPSDTKGESPAFPVAPGYDLPRARSYLEETWLRCALERNQGKVAAAAQDLGVPRTSLYDLMRKHGIKADG